MITDDAFQRTFDEWVVKNIQVRECYKFVKEKDDVDNDPICHCKNKLSKHPKLSSGKTNFRFASCQMVCVLLQGKMLKCTFVQCTVRISYCLLNYFVPLFVRPCTDDHITNCHRKIPLRSRLARITRCRKSQTSQPLLRFKLQ